MSQQNLEVVRAMYASFSRREFPTTVIDPDAVYVNPDGAVEPGTRRGIVAFRAAVEKVFESWETWQMEPERLQAVGDQVAVLVRYQARGRTSGVQLEGQESALLTIRDGKVVRYEWFHDPDGAFRAAGAEG